VESQVLPYLPRDGQGPPGKPGPGRPPADPRFRETRLALEEFAALAGELIASLRQEERVRPELRPLMGDAIAVKALADALLRRTDVQTDLAVLAEGFSAVDQRWRTLAIRLERSVGVSAVSRQCIHKLNASSGRVCQKLGLSPQVDQDQVVQLLASLNGSLRGLFDAVAQASSRSRDSQILLIEGQRLQLQINFLTATISRSGQYDEVLSQYRMVHKNWLALSSRVRSLDFRDAERHIRRINHVHRQLHDMLWIPLELDRPGLARSAVFLGRSVETLYERVSLKMLLTTGNAADAVEAAREFHGMCADFSRAAASKDSLDSLRWDFRSLDVQWQQFRSCFQDLDLSELQQHLTDVDDNLQTVQELLSISPLVDIEQAIELAGQLDSLTDVLYRDLAERLSPSSRYPPQFRREATAAAAAVHKSAHQLHEDLLRRPQSESVRKNAEQLAGDWQSLQAYVAKLEYRDRATVTRNYEHLASALARLQMMFVY
jgi:hypothetical protein